MSVGRCSAVTLAGWLLSLPVSAAAATVSCANLADGAERLLCFDVAACADLADPRRRLACFDAAAGVRAERANVDSHPPRIDAGASSAASVEITAPPEPDAIQSRIAAMVRLPRGEVVVRLDNGQVWRENEPLRSRIKVGAVATIREGLLGSYTLSHDGGPPLRVRRVDCSETSYHDVCRKIGA